jgi:hypothetical protein
VEEFWVCPHCRSLNRAGSGKCYSCKNKLGSKPREDPVRRAAAAPTPAPAPAPTRPGPTPEPGAVTAPAPFYARPVVMGPVSAGAGAVTAARQERRLLDPVGAVRRRVAWWLAMRQSVSLDWLGYLTTALLALVLFIGALLFLTVMPAATHLLQHADLKAAAAQLTTSQQGEFRLLSVAFAGIGLLTLLCFSAFLGLTTHNATGLGADQPILSPYRAGTCWAGVVWTQARIAVGLIVPTVLIWRGYAIPGLLAAIVAIEIAHRNIEDMGGWLNRPGHHLPDLYVKLGVGGSISSPLSSIWSACFRISNVLIIVCSVVPALLLGAFVALVIANRGGVVMWQATGLGPAQLVVAVLAGCAIALTTVCVALLVPITLGLTQRQRTRRTLVRVGRSRSWVARPGEGGYAPGSPGLASRYAENDDDDRIVERVPSYGDPAAGFPGPGPGFPGPGFGGPGFGGPAQGLQPGNPALGGQPFGLIGQSGPGLRGPGFGSPAQGSRPSFPGPGGPTFGGPVHGNLDQASLNSPSTTSSLPWSEDPPADSD